jgi:cytochrome P450
MALFSFTKLAIAVIALFLTHRVHWESTTGARRRALKKQHGCLPAKRAPRKDPILGIDWFIKNLKNFKEHRLLEFWQSGLRDNNAHTLSLRILGQRLYITDDVDNLKTLLATNFDDWSIGTERIKQITAFLGKGIFTTEGPAWRHSRDLLRPCFERSAVADVTMMGKHTNRLIDLMPKDGTTIDLAPLFHQLTLDIATEFLFGRSTNSLDLEPDKESREFVEAFEYCQNPMKDTEGWFNIFLAVFLPDRHLKKCARIVKGTYLRHA